jgi:hypothetical protein
MDVAIFCAAGAAVILLIGVGVARQYGWVFAADPSFDERFPPISDDEFVARCTPGTSRRVALTVRRIVAERLAVRYDQVHPSMSFIEDIGAD